MAEAQLGGLRMRDAERKPVGVMKLFSSWFSRKGETGQLWRSIGGDMPAAFMPEPEDAGDEEYGMEEAVAVAAPARALPAPRRRLRGIQPLGERFGASVEEDLRTYLERLRAWLRTLPRQSATAAAVMRFLRRQTRYTAFARENPGYSKAVNVAAKDNALHVLGGGPANNPLIRLGDAAGRPASGMPPPAAPAAPATPLAWSVLRPGAKSSAAGAKSSAAGAKSSAADAAVARLLWRGEAPRPRGG